MRYQHFSLFALEGITPGPKFAKIGTDLLPTEVYHPAKFHRPASTRAGDIRYKNILETNKESKKQTANGISPACLPTCGDNKLELFRVLWLYFVR